MVTVIGITGLTGSGKTLLSDILQKHGVPVFRTGDIIREIAESRGLYYKSLGEISLEFLPSEDITVIEKICNKINNFGQEKCVIVDGIKKKSEVEFLRKKYPTYIVAILSSQKIRFNRLVNRNRLDDPLSIDYLKERDERELKYGIGRVMALADFYFINEGKKEKLIDNFLEWFKTYDKCSGLTKTNQISILYRKD
ncbi:MAG: AAA family ATPase [Candidatus Methanoperedens sp.]|nr:AAA family ATPase [Candidatus Methanoperedens sp.]